MSHKELTKIKEMKGCNMVILDKLEMIHFNLVRFIFVA